MADGTKPEKGERRAARWLKVEDFVDYVLVPLAWVVLVCMAVWARSS